MTRIAINDFIAARGISGSSRGSRLIQEAVKISHPVEILAPQREPQNRGARLAHMLWWDFVTAPKMARRGGAGCVIHATNTGGASVGVPSIVVMHDTMVLDHPDLFDPGYRTYARVAFGLSARRASLIVTPSHHSASRISTYWPHASVQVIPWPGPQWAAEDRELSSAPLSKTILVVSSTDLHKRLDLAIEAVRTFRSETGDDFRLTFVARPGNGQRAFEAARNYWDPHGSWTNVLTGISEPQLRQLYRNSFCVLVPSLDEGYCLPAIEATAAGVPVVHCNRGALPEVIPRDGQFFEAPSDRAAILSQLHALLDAPTWQLWRDSAIAHNVRARRELFEISWLQAIEAVRP